MTEAVTQEVRWSRGMDTSVQITRVERSEVRALLSLSYDGDRNLSREAKRITLTRKTAREHTGACTANRHR
jgi:hypothetical protein